MNYFSRKSQAYSVPSLLSNDMAKEICVKCGKELGFLKFKTDLGPMCKEDYNLHKAEGKERKQEDKAREDLMKAPSFQAMTPEQQSEAVEAKIEEQRIFRFEETNEELMEGIEESLDNVIRQEK